MENDWSDWRPPIHGNRTWNRPPGEILYLKEGYLAWATEYPGAAASAFIGTATSCLLAPLLLCGHRLAECGDRFAETAAGCYAGCFVAPQERMLRVPRNLSAVSSHGQKASAFGTGPRSEWECWNLALLRLPLPDAARIVVRAFLDDLPKKIRVAADGVVTDFFVRSGRQVTNNAKIISLSGKHFVEQVDPQTVRVGCQEISTPFCLTCTTSMGDDVYTGEASGDIRRWHKQTWVSTGRAYVWAEYIGYVTIGHGAVVTAMWCDESGRVVSGDAAGNVCVWDTSAEEGICTAQFRDAGSEVTCVTSVGDVLIAGTSAGDLFVLDIEGCSVAKWGLGSRVLAIAGTSDTSAVVATHSSLVSVDWESRESREMRVFDEPLVAAFLTEKWAGVASSRQASLYRSSGVLTHGGFALEPRKNPRLLPLERLLSLEL